MNNIKHILLRNKILTLCLAVLFSVTVTYISVAIAKPVTVSDQATNCFWYQKKTYYDTETKTIPVGGRIYFCDGEIGSYGTITQYYSLEYCDCIEE